MSKTVSNIRSENPFPGLRPFQTSESHLFFGREKECDDLMSLILKNRFTAIIGASGSGKSSLIYCGIIPLLHSGLLKNASGEEVKFKIFNTRPGISPIENLATSVYNTIFGHEERSEKERKRKIRVIQAILRSSSLGLVDVLKKYASNSGCNYFIYLDQFEELLRFKNAEPEELEYSEANEYVNLIIEAIQQTEVPIFIALTMRSEYVGSCAKFPTLTEEINHSHYLIPQMVRKQLYTAIEGPIRVERGNVERRLIEKLLNDIGNNPDQLPILQHALMRTWNYWLDNKEEEESLDIHHYNAIGNISEALSLHADEAFNELSPEQKETCEVIFKTLTEKDEENQGVRRAVSLFQLTAITGKSENEIREVVDVFRKTGRSLLLPPEGQPLTSETLIDISHESLMRIWGRLRLWVEEEDESAQMYLRLAEASKLYQQGKTVLWRPPDLQLALKWQKEQKPTKAWALRYDPAYERVMLFLEASKEVYEGEQRAKERQQKRSLQRARMVAILFGAISVIALGMFVYALDQKTQSDKNARIAQLKEKEAEEHAKQEILQRIEAQKQQMEAERQRRIAVKEREEAKKQKHFAEEQKIRAQNSEQFALKEKERAEMAKLAEENQKILAIEHEKEAKKQAKIATESRNKTQSLYELTIAQAMAVKSLQVTDKELEALLAMQSYYFHHKNGGNPNDNYIYDALYYASKAHKGDHYNEYLVHDGGLRAIAVDPQTDLMYSAGSDGKIYKWFLNDIKSEAKVIQDLGQVLKDLVISPDGKRIACVGNKYTAVITVGDTAGIKKITKPGEKVSQVYFSNNSTVLFNVQHQIKVYDLKEEKVKDSIYVSDEILSLAYHRKSGQIAFGTREGKVFVQNSLKNTPTEVFKPGLPIHALAFHPKGEDVAFGTSDGIVRILDLNTNIILYTLTGHTSIVSDVKFSDDSKHLATSSLDGSVQLWSVNDLDSQPIVFKEHGSYVWSVDFSPDKNYVYAGCRDKVMKVWPVQIEELAEELAPHVLRNLNAQEWRRYAAEDVKYVEVKKFAENIVNQPLLEK